MRDDFPYGMRLNRTIVYTTGLCNGKIEETRHSEDTRRHS